MNKIVSGCLFLFLFGVVASLKAQEKRYDSKDLLEEAFQFANDEAYDKALETHKLIGRNDTNYVRSLIHKTLVYLDKEAYDDAIAVCDKALMLDIGNQSTFYINKGVSLNRKEDYHTAIKVFEEAASKFPMNNMIYYNMSLSYNNLEDYENELASLQQSVLLNPYHAYSHLRLANLCLREGKTAQATLSYHTSIMLNPNADFAVEVLVVLDQILSAKEEATPSGLDLSVGENFDEIDLLINNYAALSKKYKVRNDIKTPLVKQSHMIFSQLELNNKSKGFWTKTYVPIFKKIMDEEKYNDYIYYIFTASENPRHKKIISKKNNTISKLTTWLANVCVESFSKQFEFKNGKLKTKHYWYSNTNDLEAIGNYNEEELPVGDWKYYYSNGAYEGGGAYNSKGKRIGNWVWYYPNGDVEYDINYNDQGDFDGAYTSYYKNGEKEEWLTYVDGEKKGDYKIYFPTGALKQEGSYRKNDEIEGPCKIYFETGKLQYEFSYKDAEIDGVLKEYYNNGALKREANFVEGKQIGVEKNYYSSGELYFEENYVNSELDSIQKTFYRDGSLMRSSYYKEGSIIGESISYYKDGTIESSGLYDENGKETGLYSAYDTDGKLHYQYEYKKGDIVAYKYFDKAGDLLSEGKKKIGGNFDFKGYTVDGYVSLEGKYDSDGGRIGKWYDYDENGNKSSVSNYSKDSKLENEYLSFHKNAKVSIKSNYVNGDLDGTYLSYHGNGKIYKDGYYDNGDAQNDWYFYYSDGTLKEKSFYKDGNLHGVSEEYSVNGKLHKEYWYDDGNLQQIILFDTLGVAYDSLRLKQATGVIRTTDQNGVVQGETSYLRGYKHGPYKYYYENGNVLIEGDYENSNKVGLWKKYYENGQLMSEYNYVFGYTHGDAKAYHEDGSVSKKANYFYGDPVIVTYYHESGEIDSESTYKNGLKEGASNFYGVDGSFSHVRYYSKGKLIGYSYKGKNGKLIDMIPIEAETGELESYYANGKPSRKFGIKNGEFNGAYYDYHSNGNIKEERIYVDDEIDGDSKEYYEDGTLASFERYNYGEYDGLSQYYSKKGVIKEALNFHIDYRDAWSLYYDENGNLIKRRFYYNGQMLKEEIVNE